MSGRILLAGLAWVAAAVADVPPNRLVLHYAFDLDSGRVAGDSSPCGNEGQLIGTRPIPGVHGNGLQFDGRSAFIRTLSTPSLMPEDLTLSAWVRLDEWPQGVVALIFKRNLGHHDNEGYSLQITPTGKARFVLGNGRWQRILDSSAALEPGRWHHVAATFSQPSMTVYVDGILLASGVYDHPMQHNPGADLFIGARDHLAHPMDSFAQVGLDDVRIYARALSDVEIMGLAMGGAIWLPW